jgi:hypothetical protein
MSCFVCKGRRRVLRWVETGPTRRDIHLMNIPCYGCGNEQDEKKEKKKSKDQVDRDELSHVARKAKEDDLPLFD